MQQYLRGALKVVVVVVAFYLVGSIFLLFSYSDDFSWVIEYEVYPSLSTFSLPFPLFPLSLLFSSTTIPNLHTTYIFHPFDFCWKAAKVFFSVLHSHLIFHFISFPLLSSHYIPRANQWFCAHPHTQIHKKLMLFFFVPPRDCFLVSGYAPPKFKRNNS